MGELQPQQPAWPTSSVSDPRALAPLWEHGTWYRWSLAGAVRGWQVASGRPPAPCWPAASWGTARSAWSSGGTLDRWTCTQEHGWGIFHAQVLLHVPQGWMSSTIPPRHPPTYCPRGTRWSPPGQLPRTFPLHPHLCPTKSPPLLPSPRPIKGCPNSQCPQPPGLPTSRCPGSPCTTIMSHSPSRSCGHC